MRIHTLTTWELLETGEWVLLRDDSYDYNGPVALAGKNRKEKKELAKLQADQAKQAAIDAANAKAIQDANRAKSDSLIEGYESQGLDELSPQASAQLGSDTENIIRTYSGLRQNAERALGARGFGRAPSGFHASAIAGINEGQAADETGAYRRALDKSEEGRRLALGYRTGQQQFYDPMSRRSGASNIAGDAVNSYDKVGSTFGDIMSGLSALSSVASIPMGGGSSMFSKLMTKKPPVPAASALQPQVRITRT